MKFEAGSGSRGGGFSEFWGTLLGALCKDYSIL